MSAGAVKSLLEARRHEARIHLTQVTTALLLLFKALSNSFGIISLLLSRGSSVTLRSHGLFWGHRLPAAMLEIRTYCRAVLPALVSAVSVPSKHDRMYAAAVHLKTARKKKNMFKMNSTVVEKKSGG